MFFAVFGNSSSPYGYAFFSDYLFSLPLAGDSIDRENKYDKNNLWISNMHQLKSHPRIGNMSSLRKNKKRPLSEAQPWLPKVITIIRF